MSKKKILYVVTKSVWGGAQRYVYDLATHLPGDKFEPVIAAGGKGLLFEKLRLAGIKTISIPELERDIYIGKELRAIRRLYKIFAAEKPGVIHLNSSKAAGIGALAAWLYKIINNQLSMIIIFTVHGWPFREDRSPLARAAIFAASWASALLADKIILITKADFKTAQKFIPGRKLAFIHNGIEPAEVLSCKEARTLLAEKLGRPILPQAILLGAIAELTKNKGISYFISALSRLNLNNHYRGLASIVVIGEGEERVKLEKQIESLKLQNTVRLAGFVPEAHRHLPAFDIFILPSVKEGLPYTVMEAMAAGIPVVATAVGGIPDLITHEEDGILIPPKHPQAIAQALSSLLEYPARRKILGNRGRRVIKTKFPLQNMIAKTITVYEQTPSI